MPYRYLEHLPIRKDDINWRIHFHRFAACGHVFCFICVEEIFNKNTWYDLDTCPACKTPILEPPKRDTVLEDVIYWLTDMNGETRVRELAIDPETPMRELVIDQDYFDYRFKEERVGYHRLVSLLD